MAIVYKITFPNNKVYIGITNGTLEQRKKEHFSRKNNGYTNAIYNALRKYNNQEKWDILDNCSSYEEAKIKEKHYIKTFKSNNNKFGYNMTAGGDGTVGYKFSDLQKQRMSKSHKTDSAINVSKSNLLKMKNKKGVIKNNTKKIIMTDLSNGKITIIRSMMDLVDLGFSKAHVSACCLNKRKTHKNHTFTFLKD